RLQGAFAADVAFGPAQVADGVGHHPSQDLPQPGRLFGRALAAELLPRRVGLEQRLLHQVGWVELGLEARIELEPRQQPQVLAETLEVQSLRRGVGAHARSLCLKTPNAPRLCAKNEDCPVALPRRNAPYYPAGRTRLQVSG